MAETRLPLGDMNPDEKTALYIAALERKLVVMTINEMKYRTLLEMLTGEEWDEINTSIHAGELRKIAVNATQRRLARSLAEAEAQVEANIESANQFARPDSQ